MSALIRPHHGVSPTIADSAFIAETTVIIGEVEIAEDASIWYGAVLRGDGNYIKVGARTNVQDGCIVHINSGLYPCLIGADITIGHGAIIHACTLEDECFVGMGAIVLDGAVVERHAMVAAGALVSPGKRVPSGELWAGNPAKKLRDLRPEDIEGFKASVTGYVALSKTFL
jgi:carbonic anhydrase/acetyltransferase-like protein (isoleucine patch superfamily)